MELTITEAAHLLGRNTRQIRYMIKSGKLKAQKRAGKWSIDRDELPLSDEQASATTRKLEQAKVIVEEALGAPLAVAEEEAMARRRRYAIAQQPAFRLALPAYREALTLLGGDHAAAVALRQALFLITEGWHEFQARHKIPILRQARQHLCQALTELLLIDDGNPETVALAETIELRILPSLGGMLRHAEKRSS